jgi:hypothetical protein
MMDKNILPPEDRELAEQLESLAQQARPTAAFERELEKRLMQTQSPAPKAKGFFAQAWPSIGLALGLILLALILTRVLRTMPPQPAAGNTPLPPPNETLPAPKPAGKTYDWNGVTLYLQTMLPETPTAASIYQTAPMQHATLESARALATRFGMAGQIYLTPPEVPGTADNDFLVIDGKQRLQIRSDQYFLYYPDYAPPSSALPVDIPNADAIIRDFLTAKKFDFEYQVEKSDVPGTYIVLPLTPDGFSIRNDYFSSVNLTFQFDANGHFAVISNQVKYTPVSGQTYPIITAEQAFQKMLDITASAGVMTGQTSPYQPMSNWERPRHENETLTLWGWMSSFASAEGGAPFVTLEGYTAIGNIADVAPNLPNTYVEAIGQFQTVGGVKVFKVESWKVYEGFEDGIFGALQRDGENVVMVTDQGKFILPEVPGDVPLPMENAYAIGVKQGNVFEWKTLDDTVGGGGGGGGGGSGFYKINLSGTPVPFPTAGPTVGGGVGGGGAGFMDAYLVQAGDTIDSIAAANGITPEQLMEVNGMSDPSELQVGQTIVIQSGGISLPQTVEGLRGTLSITIFEQTDGGQRVSYGFLTADPNYPYLILEGNGLEGLQSYNGRPVDIWGTVNVSHDTGLMLLNVDRFEIPFPDLQFQILKGMEKSVEIDGQTVLLFTDENGRNYVELAPNCYDVIGAESVIGTGRENAPILLEALPVPDLTFGDYPAICVSSSMMIDPNSSQPQELTVTADQPSVLPEQPSVEAGNAPTLTIEKVELVYFVVNQRYILNSPSGPVYIQPAWRFYGHYSDGSAFEGLVQALDPLFLLPEIEEINGPG